ncbi:MAG: hypothetical protein IID09_00780 [Candidatus Hydrogenedentes bacterium]|nr:hypothetical protein [Candidatus Hydrogenedentota bacterium]
MIAKSWKIGLVGVAAVALFLAAPAVQAAWFGSEEKKEVDESIPLDGADKINISFSVGELEIVHGPDDTIEIEGKITIKSHNRRRIERLLEELELDIETGDTISITLPKSGMGKNYGIELTVRVPRGVDLDVGLKVGVLKAEIEMPASARFEVNVGELAIRMPRSTSAEVYASVSIGEVEVEGFDEHGASSRRRHLLGASYEGAIGENEAATERRLRAEVNIGEVSVKGRS